MEPLDIWGRPEKATPHRFEWALKTLRDGGKVRRSTWAEGSYIYRNEHNVLVFFLGGTRLVKEIPHNCDWQDLAATDWRRA